MNCINNPGDLIAHLEENDLLFAQMHTLEAATLVLNNFYSDKKEVLYVDDHYLYFNGEKITIDDIIDSACENFFELRNNDIRALEESFKNFDMTKLDNDQYWKDVNLYMRLIDEKEKLDRLFDQTIYGKRIVQFNKSIIPDAYRSKVNVLK